MVLNIVVLEYRVQSRWGGGGRGHVQGAQAQRAASVQFPVCIHSPLSSISRTYNSANLGPYGPGGKEKLCSHSSHSCSSASNSSWLQNASEDLGPRALSAISML